MRMLEQVMVAPGFLTAAQRAGVYGPVLAWMDGRRRGWVQPFPYATGRGDRIHLEGGGGGYRTPVYAAPSAPAPPAPPTGSQIYGPASAALIVSPAAKALDYFQESLELLGIDESETLTAERLKAAYRQASRTAHPDRGGTKEAFDELNRAYVYVGKILERVRPRTTAEESARMATPVTMESAVESRARTAPVAAPAAPAVKLSAKKLDMAMFNRLFEENRLPDPVRDTGYGDWMKREAAEGISANGGLASFESKVREFSRNNPGAIIKRPEPDALMTGRGATVLGEDANNFTAAFGADTQFTDIKEAYTTGSVAYLEVADVRVKERSARSVEEAQRIRETEMSRVDPDESTRIAMAAAALEERERKRQLRAAAADTAMDAWAAAMRGRLAVTDT